MRATSDESDKQLLDFLQFHLEREISNWAIDATEDLFDEDNEKPVVRSGFRWSVPDGYRHRTNMGDQVLQTTENPQGN